MQDLIVKLMFLVISICIVLLVTKGTIYWKKKKSNIPDKDFVVEYEIMCVHTDEIIK